jgi:hypothetical protein
MSGILQRSARSQVAARSLLLASATRPVTIQTAFYCNPTVPSQLAMKVGTVLPGLDFIKDTDEVVTKKRSDYPDWVDSLAKPMLSLAKLRRMTEEEATDKEKERYLKLSRRQDMKSKNAEAGV